jgi:benzodiazapine receptor
MVFFIFLLACAAAASTGVIFKPGEWYASLVKPRFTPPNWAFPVAWTVIYLLLALWTPVFFGAHRLLAGMVIIVVLWLVTAAMVALAMRLDVITGLILFPYLAWLCVAAALNFSILRNNR